MCLRWHILINYCFVAEVNFKEYALMFSFKSVQYDKMQESAGSKGRNSYLLLGNYGDWKELASSKYFR